MKRRSLIYVTLLAALIFGCAKKAPKMTEGGISRESSTVKFWGYKVTVLVDATPEQLEDYLTTADRLKQEVGGIKIERISGERMSKVGDSANYVIKVPGVPIPYKLTMIRYVPREEIWYMSETGNEFVVSVLRYQMKRVKDGTLLTVRFDLEEPTGPILKAVSEQINLQSLMVKGTEQGTAMIQQYFNHSLTVKDLLEKGLRGDFYITFFSAIRESSIIDASPQKVHKYLTNPQTWDAWQKKYKINNMGPCLTSLAEGACQASVNIMGIEYKLSFTSANYEPGKYASSYFTLAEAGVGRVQTFIKPKGGQTELSIEYMVQLSQASPAATELLVNLSQMPKILDSLITDAKTELERRAGV